MAIEDQNHVVDSEFLRSCSLGRVKVEPGGHQVVRGDRLGGGQGWC